jgi:enterochelin esterase-like enzyme
MLWYLAQAKEVRMNGQEIEAFPPEVADRLKTYVYRLIDPRNGETFYVGKGKGNRVFAHVRAEQNLEGDELGNKLKKLYVGKRVPDEYRKPGAANPIKYTWWNPLFRFLYIMHWIFVFPENLSMKSLSVVLLLSVVTSVSAQPLVSPEVQGDGRVTFRLKAPDAREVVLRCEGTKGGPMQKGEGGVWSLTTEPMQPDIYAYSFTVDGVKTIDPANPLLKYNLLNTDSQVHVPGPATLAWEINDVPHGVIHRHLYRSAVVGDERPFLVYTPPGYDPAAKQPYPVLYLLHGYSDAEDAWTSVGRANIILDNLIARGRAKPMLIVMPLGYGNKEVIAGGWAGLRNVGVWQDSIVKFREALLNEVIPQVEKAYHVATDANARAIAGLSMGGSQSLFIGLNAPDRFGWIGAFSSGGLQPDFESQFSSVNESLNSRLHLLWIGCGQQDWLMGSNQKLVEWLKSKGVKLTWVETPGTHSFTLWRRYLADFVPLLFREGPQGR